ncbi:MAG: aspartate/glutamate racemase family protein [Planctomycetes bacterium]|nr:aspartate/glutamate racemase family protein [Planctomycetota bacterium]
MKTIGLLGGMSWQSTITYYRAINQIVRQKLGGQHSAKVIINSVDFDEIVKLQNDERWDALAEILIDATKSLEHAGADLLVICANTMHKVEPQISKACSIEIVHIADATADTVIKAGIKNIGLIGTKYTMEQEFYKGRLEKNHSLSVIIPNETDRKIVHKVIYDELCYGQVIESSREEFKRIITSLKKEGAEGIILGCTEFGLLIHQDNVDLPIFDTTLIHATSAVETALESKTKSGMLT